MADRTVLEVKLVSIGEGDGIPERRILLAAGQDVIVGRASSNRGVAASADNTKINNPVISKEHASFTTDVTGTSVYIKDLRSMHGTRVDGQQLSQMKECQVYSGSTVQFGSSVIRGNATYKPAKYTFYVDAINPTTFADPTPQPMAQSQAFSDTKKGYGDDSSQYSEDIEDSDIASASDQDQGDIVPDTYSSERDDSEEDSLSSDSVEDEDSEDSDDQSVEDYCPTETAHGIIDTPAEASSAAPAQEHSSFSSSSLEQGELFLQTPSAQPSGPPMGFDMGMLTGEWPEYSEADNTTYFGSSAWNSEPVENFGVKIESDELRPTKKLKFGNSINELCEPIPEADGAVEESSAAAAGTEFAEQAQAADDKLREELEFIDNTLAQAKADEGSPLGDFKAETTGSKRTADEAGLELDSVTDAMDSVQLNQPATPEQMSSRRIASFTRRARDFGIGVVVGGAALFTVLASMGEGA